MNEQIIYFQKHQRMFLCQFKLLPAASITSPRLIPDKLWMLGLKLGGYNKTDQEILIFYISNWR